MTSLRGCLVIRKLQHTSFVHLAAIGKCSNRKQTFAPRRLPSIFKFKTVVLSVVDRPGLFSVFRCCCLLLPVFRTAPPSPLEGQPTVTTSSSRTKNQDHRQNHKRPRTLPSSSNRRLHCGPISTLAIDDGAGTYTHYDLPSTVVPEAPHRSAAAAACHQQCLHTSWLWRLMRGQQKSKSARAPTWWMSWRRHASS